MSIVNCYNSDGDADSCGGDDDDNADNNVCCKLLQDPTPLPYLQHSDNYTFDIKLEVALSCKCLTQFLEWLVNQFWDFNVPSITQGRTRTNSIVNHTLKKLCQGKQKVIHSYVQKTGAQFMGSGKGVIWWR